MIYLGILLFSAAFAALSRACGANFYPRIFKVVYGLAYAIPAALLSWYWTIPAAATAILFKLTGHGQYMDLGHYTKESNRKQFVDPLVSLFFGPDPNWTGEGCNKWRDFFGLTITGIGVGIGLGVVLSLNGLYLEAFVVILTCALKGVAYGIGWTVNSSKATEIGEELTGFFGGMGLAWVVARILGVL